MTDPIRTDALPDGGTREWYFGKTEINRGTDYYGDWRTVWCATAVDTYADGTEVCYWPAVTKCDEQAARDAFEALPAEPEMRVRVTLVKQIEQD